MAIDSAAETKALVQSLFSQSQVDEIKASHWSADRTGRVMFNMHTQRAMYRVHVKMHRMGTFGVVLFASDGGRVWETFGVDPYDLGRVFTTLPSHL